MENCKIRYSDEPVDVKIHSDFSTQKSFKLKY